MLFGPLARGWRHASMRATRRLPGDAKISKVKLTGPHTGLGEMQKTIRDERPLLILVSGHHLSIALMA